MFTARNVRCIRPGQGLRPRHLSQVLGRAAALPSDAVRHSAGSSWCRPAVDDALAISSQITANRLRLEPFSERHLTSRYVGWLNDRGHPLQ